jgi:hypothetical protein
MVPEVKVAVEVKKFKDMGDIRAQLALLPEGNFVLPKGLKGSEILEAVNLYRQLVAAPTATGNNDITADTFQTRHTNNSALAEFSEILDDPTRLVEFCEVWGGYLYDLLNDAERNSEWHKTALLEKLLKFQAIAPGRREKLPGKKDRTDWDTGKHPHSSLELMSLVEQYEKQACSPEKFSSTPFHSSSLAVDVSDVAFY